MIIPWFIVWLLCSTPHITVLPFDRTNGWGLSLVIALLLA